MSAATINLIEKSENFSAVHMFREANDPTLDQMAHEPVHILPEMPHCVRHTIVEKPRRRKLELGTTNLLRYFCASLRQTHLIRFSLGDRILYARKCGVKRTMTIRSAADRRRRRGGRSSDHTASGTGMSSCEGIIRSGRGMKILLNDIAYQWTQNNFAGMRRRESHLQGSWHVCG